MAKIISPLLEFTAATSASMLTTSRKLSRNFAYYKQTQETGYVTRDKLLFLCNKIRLNLFGLYNLFLDREGEHSPFMVSIAGDVHDSYEHLHRSILFYDADDIDILIPEIDRERSFWNQYSDYTFYSESLFNHIENRSTSAIAEIERNIKNLPAKATL